MSRRAKLLLLTPLFLLLAIPVVYVILSWSPHEPWRARLVAVQDHQEGGGKNLVIEVENMSSVPLCIYMAMLQGPAAPPDTSFPPMLEPLGPGVPSPLKMGDEGYSLHVPPRQVQRFHIPVSVADFEKMPAGEWTVGLGWASGTKHRALTCVLWLQRTLPSSWEDYVPFPSLDDSDVLLDTGESASQTVTLHQ